VEKNPQSVSVYFSMGDILSRAGKFEEAKEWFEKAVELSPFNRWWEFRLINNLAMAGDYVEAEKLAQEYINYYPNTEDGYLNLHWIYAKQGRFAEAQSVIETAQEKLKEPSANFYNKLGQAYESLDQIELALYYYRLAYNISPDQTETAQRIEYLESLSH
jgi:tetratricopeptide (TPR) repeat protein